jgi:hypothetical protein
MDLLRILAGNLSAGIAPVDVGLEGRARIELCFDHRTLRLVALHDRGHDSIYLRIFRIVLPRTENLRQCLGEELLIENADKAWPCCEMSGAEIRDYSAALFTLDENQMQPTMAHRIETRRKPRIFYEILLTL